ncbi:hypothetical protein C8F01DRAFT_35024 [Mycena amicta]|nr:hypothetical protein C8F01DRAFT_35024 [Mycena amicta]
MDPDSPPPRPKHHNYLILIENSPRLHRFWPQMRSTYLARMVNQLRGMHPLKHTSVFLIETRPQCRQFTPRLYGTVELAVEGVQFDFGEPDNRVSPAHIGAGIQFLLSKQTPCLRHLIVVAATAPVDTDSTAALPVHASVPHDPWLAVERLLVKEEIYFQLTLSSNLQTGRLTELFDRTFRAQRHTEEPLWLATYSTDILCRLSVMKRYPDVVLGSSSEGKTTRRSTSTSHLDLDLELPSHPLLSNDASAAASTGTASSTGEPLPMLVTKLQQQHGLAKKKKIYGTKPARQPFFADARTRYRTTPPGSGSGGDAMVLAAETGVPPSLSLTGRASASGEQRARRASSRGRIRGEHRVGRASLAGSVSSYPTQWQQQAIPGVGDAYAHGEAQPMGHGHDVSAQSGSVSVPLQPRRPPFSSAPMPSFSPYPTPAPLSLNFNFDGTNDVSDSLLSAASSGSGSSTYSYSPPFPLTPDSPAGYSMSYSESVNAGAYAVDGCAAAATDIPVGVGGGADDFTLMQQLEGPGFDFNFAQSQAYGYDSNSMGFDSASVAYGQAEVDVWPAGNRQMYPAPPSLPPFPQQQQQQLPFHRLPHRVLAPHPRRVEDTQPPILTSSSSSSSSSTSAASSSASHGQNANSGVWIGHGALQSSDSALAQGHVHVHDIDPDSSLNLNGGVVTLSLNHHDHDGGGPGWKQKQDYFNANATAMRFAPPAGFSFSMPLNPISSSRHHHANTNMNAARSHSRLAGAGAYDAQYEYHQTRPVDSRSDGMDGQPVFGATTQQQYQQPPHHQVDYPFASQSQSHRHPNASASASTVGNSSLTGWSG